MTASPEFLELSDQATALKPGRYRHFKGEVYRVLGVGKHTETLEEFVVYQPEPVEDPLFHVRPLTNFFEVVDKPEYHYHGPRFIRVEDTV